MIDHPHITDLSKLSDVELSDGIAKLGKRLHWFRTRGQTALISQVEMILGTYRREWNTRQQREWVEKYGDRDNYSNKIDITG
jgi:hypothetical protein